VAPRDDRVAGQAVFGARGETTLSGRDTLGKDLAGKAAEGGKDTPGTAREKAAPSERPCPIGSLCFVVPGEELIRRLSLPKEDT
jgi:hypothetical protein